MPFIKRFAVFTLREVYVSEIQSPQKATKMSYYPAPSVFVQGHFQPHLRLHHNFLVIRS